MSDEANVIRSDGLPKLALPGEPDIRGRKLHEAVFVKTHIGELKGRSVRGGIVTMISQGLKYVLQMGSTMILARLLSKEDFGLQGMVFAVTGVLALFKDAGLSAATVQRDTVTHEQISTLFWINVLVGVALTGLAAVLAPALVAFYHEPRLFWVTIASAAVFLLNGIGAQHAALLQRGMRYVTMAKIDVLSLAVSSAVGVGMAAYGFGYWALVGMVVSGTLVSTIGAWIAVPWLPGMPSRECGIRSMLHFGGIVTLNSLVVYVAYNAEKILLGRYWGAAALGLYGRAYQLLNLPLQQLHTSMYTVAFPALSRIQDNAERLCRSFLKGYSVLLSMTLPITLASAIFAEEIIRILLGPKWTDAAPILRLLTPTILIFAMINPFGWFLFATGRTARSLKMALVITPVVILGIVAGMKYGPKGVALGYSTAMTILIVPLIAWAMHGTGITGRDFWKTIKQPFLSGLIAGVAGLVFKIAVNGMLPPIPLLALGLLLVFGLYAWILLMVMGQKDLYSDLMKQVIQRKALKAKEDQTE